MAQEGVRVGKSWGAEFILTNTQYYCCKNLFVQAGKISSLHRHIKKNETFICQEGEGWLEVGEFTYFMRPSAFVHVPAGVWHRFWTTHQNGMKLLEVSTHHDDADVERQQESGNLDYAPLLSPAEPTPPPAANEGQ